MNIEEDLIISTLRLTKNGLVSHELINKDAKIPSRIGRKLLEKQQNDGLIYLWNDYVDVDSFQRLKLAIRAISLGADLETVSDFLHWQEFEGMAALALELNDYKVTKNLRFTHAGRKWEIDIVGCRKPLVICMDCKHWHHGMHPSSLRKAAEEQVERTKAVAESMPNLAKIGCSSWDAVKFIPAILSLVTSKFKFYKSVPIVPILQLQDFLNQLPAYADSLELQ